MHHTHDPPITQMTHLTLVAMGDSITFGQYVDPTLRWTSLIDERIAQMRPAARITLLNRGVSGETTRLGLERFPADVQRARPSIMTLQFGLNDCNCWQTDEGLPRVSEKAFEANLVEMIARARRFGAEHIILSTNPPTLRWTRMPNGEPYEHANRRYSDIIRGVAEDCNVTLCDIQKAFVAFSEAELEKLLLPAPDLLHPSPDGHRLYADVIWPPIRAALTSALAASTQLQEARS